MRAPIVLFDASLRYMLCLGDGVLVDVSDDVLLHFGVLKQRVLRNKIIVVIGTLEYFLFFCLVFALVFALDIRKMS